MIDHRVYLVTDNPSRYKGNWLDMVRAAVDGGVTSVQYRDTESDAQTQYTRICLLRDAIGTTPIIINNDAELAKAVSADGVHVGQSDMAPEAVRAIVGTGCEIGLSITATSQIARLQSLVQAKCVDFIGIGPIFDARKTKADAAKALGLDTLREIATHSSNIPNCAIGGITLDNAQAVIDAGAHGLAVVSAFSKSDNPYESAKKFRMLFDHCGK